MTQELINEKWESNFFYEGSFGIVYDYLVKGTKHQFSVTSESDYIERLLDKNPTLKEITKASIEVQKEILQEFTQLPNCIWEDPQYEFKECEVIKKHIVLGNIRVDEDFQIDFDFTLELDANLIVEDIVYKDLCKTYINNNADWKNHFKEHKQHEIEYDQAMSDIDRRQQEVMSILAQHGTDIFGTNL